MIVKHHRQFKKNFKKRILPKSELVKKFQKRIKLFLKNPNSKILKNHQLKGKKRSYWSFSITRDIRIIYKVEKKIIKLYDIGTHNQVY